MVDDNIQNGDSVLIKKRGSKLCKGTIIRNRLFGNNNCNRMIVLLDNGQRTIISVDDILKE